MTKKDLKDGMRVKFRNNTGYRILISGALFGLKDDLTRKSHSNLDDFEDDLTFDGYSDLDIMRIETILGLFLWERKEVEEMTLGQVCEALGKDIKIIK